MTLPMEGKPNAYLPWSVSKGHTQRERNKGMSKESLEDLNKWTLIGFTEKRGTAWHYRAGSDNHYPGAIPAEDVRRRLFYWTAESTPLYVNRGKLTRVPGRQAIVRGDTGSVLGVFKDGYLPHQYSEWLIDNVQNILDDDLAIGSAGLLSGGGQAWVSVEVPDTITTSAGVAYRPHLLASTSLDGTLATGYSGVVTNVVCDNTMAAALSEKGFRYKLKHTKNSKFKITEARQALDMIHKVSEAFEEEVEALLNVSVSDTEWSNFLDAWSPTDGKEGRSLTMAVGKREALTELWNADPMVAPWRSTGWGVVQAVNTFDHHHGKTNGGDDARPARNMALALKGRWEDHDAATLDTLRKVKEDIPTLS